MQDNIIVFPEPPPGDKAQLVTRGLPVSLTSLIGREHELKAQTYACSPLLEWLV